MRRLTARSVLILLFASVFYPLGSSQGSAAELTVRIRDAQDGKPLPGAVVAVLGTAFGAVADSVGICRVDGLPAGRYNVQCSHVGYGPQTLRDLSTDGLVHNADLTASAVALPGVVVSALRRPQSRRRRRA